MVKLVEPGDGSAGICTAGSGEGACCENLTWRSLLMELVEKLCVGGRAG